MEGDTRNDFEKNEQPEDLWSRVVHLQHWRGLCVIGVVAQ